jgi:hypothetical protein
MASNRFDHSPDPNQLPVKANSTKQTHTCKLSAAFGPKTVRSQLGVDFQPSDHSVICGRDRQLNHHTGNRRFRILASTFVERYSQAGSKTTKSALVFNIITMIRQAGGHFCKYEKGAWFEVGDRCILNTDHLPGPRPLFGGLENETKPKPKCTASTWLTAPRTGMIPQCRRHAREAAQIPWGSITLWK